jgi:glycosyltransferase involved in cell wall biosynthesis
MTDPVISVIIPAFNAEKYIVDALDSVRCQSVTDIEIIVVNDGSTDDTRQLVENAVLKDARLRLIDRQNSGKPAIARNKGIAVARGEYIAFLDADDLMLPGKLDAQLRVFESISDLGMVFHDWCVIDPNGNVITDSRLNQVGYLAKAAASLEDHGERIFTTGGDYYNFMSTNIVGVHTGVVMVKREILKNEPVLFPEDMVIGEDVDLWYRIFMKYRAAFIDHVYSCYRQHSGSITRDKALLIRGGIAVREKNLDRGSQILTNNEMRRIRRKLAREYRKLGYLYYKNHNRKEARQCYRKSMLYSPRPRYLLSYIKAFIT